MSILKKLFGKWTTSHEAEEPVERNPKLKTPNALEILDALLHSDAAPRSMPRIFELIMSDGFVKIAELNPTAEQLRQFLELTREGIKAAVGEYGSMCIPPGLRINAAGPLPRETPSLWRQMNLADYHALEPDTHTLVLSAFRIARRSIALHALGGTELMTALPLPRGTAIKPDAFTVHEAALMCYAYSVLKGGKKITRSMYTRETRRMINVLGITLITLPQAEIAQCSDEHFQRAD